MYYWEKKYWNAAQSFCDLTDLFGEETISKRQTDKDGSDEEGRGRLSNFNDRTFLTAVYKINLLTHMYNIYIT